MVLITFHFLDLPFETPDYVGELVLVEHHLTSKVEGEFLTQTRF